MLWNSKDSVSNGAVQEEGVGRVVRKDKNLKEGKEEEERIHNLLGESVSYLSFQLCQDHGLRENILLD